MSERGIQKNFSEESQQILVLAKSKSVSQLKPVIKEELVFFAMIYMEHPLWLVLQNKLRLNGDFFKNTIWNELIQSNSDNPSNSMNITRQKEFFECAKIQADNDKTQFIEPYHLLKAAVMTTDSIIPAIFEKQGVNKDSLLKEIDQMSYADLANIVTKTYKHREYAPSRRIKQVAQDYSSGMNLTDAGRNLNEMAKLGKLDPVFFRDEEIKTTIEILCRRQQNNPLLIGEAGVGKTAIVEGIANLIVAEDVPEIMKDKIIIELSITSLVAGTTLRGEFEQRIQAIIKECEKDPHIILFIDEIHMIVGAGGQKGLDDAANIFKPALARGNLRCIGATTLKEGRQFIDKDKALKRRFQPVMINEPTVYQTIDILNRCKGKFESFHKVTISEEAIKMAADLAHKYIKDRFFPGKAIDLLDHACAREKIEPESDKIVTAEEIAAIVAKDAQVPITQVLVGKMNELSLLEERLRQRVIGQDEAVKSMVEVIHLTKMGMDINPQRPEGVFLLVGPAGVGKTELAKALTEALLGDEMRMISLDMAEYKDQTSINRLIGSAPGYVGYEQESKLISSVRSNPNSVILMDEIEKAHPDALAILKQVFDKGVLTAPDGESVFFSHATFILTSNIGEGVLKDEMANLSVQACHRQIKTILQEEVKKRFNPGFLRAIDKEIYFNALASESMRIIISKKLQMIIKRLNERGVALSISNDIEEYLVTKGYSIQFGAKFVNKIIEDNVLKPLTRYMLSYSKSRIHIFIDESGEVAFGCE